MQINEWKDGKKMKVRTQLFDNFEELLDFAQDRSKPYCGGSRSSERLNEDEWSGPAKDFPECVQMARYGWPAGRELVEAITAKFEGITASKIMRPQVAYDVAGDCVDVGRFVTGEPECMMVFEETEAEGPGKIIRMECCISTSAGISAAQMAIRGAAACALVDALEQCGKSVELVITVGQERNGSRYEFYCPVKAAGEPLDIDRLSFMLAHAGFYRRIGFACMENQPPAIVNHHGFTQYGGYSMPTAAKGGDFKADITVPHMLLESTPEACVQWVLQTLKEQGVEIEGA